ncbi:MAG: excinuclease ABC subunit UvrA [Gemmatimonadota bacterium]
MPPSDPPVGPDRRTIRVLGARQHNLKGVDLELPRRAITVVTGPSGSGKSSLAFDTIYAEGQRRYVESLSTYAKQFLDQIEKPAVEWIEGVSPAVSIDQRNTVQTSRSTVGTTTEVYGHLRLLWARVGRTICPECGERVTPDTVTSATDDVLELEEGTRIYVAFPLELSDEITHDVAVTNLKTQGYVRVLADGEEVYLPDLEVDREGEDEGDAGASAGTAGTEAEGGGGPDRSGGVPPSETEGGGDGRGRPVDLADADELLVVVDRLGVDPEARERIADALAGAFAEGDGVGLVIEAGSGGPGSAVRHRFDEAFRCDGCGREFPEPTPALFSFNSAAGACPECEGFGATLEYDLDLIVPDPDRPVGEGALDPWTMPRYDRQRRRLREFLHRRQVDPSTPWRDVPEEVRRELLYGSPEFQGMLPFMESRESKKYKRYIRVFLRQYQKPVRCAECGGDRLRDEALDVRVGDRTISEVARLPVSDLLAWLRGLEPDLERFEAKVAGRILEELEDRVHFLDAVGLGYLTLDRQARTLSGGEMQRIRLAGCLGARLVDTLYVLDEPTIGLHPHDVERFLDVLTRLRAGGNTVLMVEHEPEVMRVADRLVEMGPASGERGGEVVYEGDWEGLVGADTVTGRALAERSPGASRERREPSRGWLRLENVRLHNIDGMDVGFPLGCLTAVTGVSGSGKSTLVHDVLFHALERKLEGETSAKEHLGEETGELDALEGAGALDEVAMVDQSPIGRTPRSNPVTYIKAFSPIRKLFSEQPLSVSRGFEPGHFSFNVEGGRCEACKGTGQEDVDMVFMADVSTPCEICGGKRYRPEVLEVEYRGRSIHDVLQMTVDEAIRFFARQDRVGQALWQLQRVGLGYLRLGQPATTLSGGEAQRLKVARELARAAGSGRRLYILDEPTVGLGLSEVSTLVRVLDELVKAGHTVVVVEHDLEVVRNADWVVDLGPGAADEGGEVVVAGPPEEVASCDASLTGDHLRRRRERIRERPAAG